MRQTINQAGNGGFIRDIYDINNGMAPTIRFKFPDIWASDRIRNFVTSNDLIILQFYKGEAILQSFTVSRENLTQVYRMDNDSLVEWMNALWRQQCFRKKADRT
ncbi:MAG: hypothetical protein Q9224_002601 [Gallowayella concinna]